MPPVFFQITEAVGEIPKLPVYGNQAAQTVEQAQHFMETGQRKPAKRPHQRAFGVVKGAVAQVAAQRQARQIDVKPAALFGKDVLPQAHMKPFGIGLKVVGRKVQPAGDVVENDLQRSAFFTIFVPMKSGNQDQGMFVGLVLEVPPFKEGAADGGSMKTGFGHKKFLLRK